MSSMARCSRRDDAVVFETDTEAFFWLGSILKGLFEIQKRSRCGLACSAEFG